MDRSEDLMPLPRGQYAKYHTFISYQSADSKVAEELTIGLQNQGLRIWFDRDPGTHARDPRDSSDPRGNPIPGDESDVESVLELAVYFSIFVTVITSESTLRSVWVRKEIAMTQLHNKPLFFVHCLHTEEQVPITIRTEGPAWDGKAESVKKMSKHYRTEYLASRAAADLMSEISNQRNLNIIGHTIQSGMNIHNSCIQLNELIELSELVLHKSETLSSESLERNWVEYSRYVSRAQELYDQIYNQFGQAITVDRAPCTNGFRLKRPFVIGRVRHLERMLEDASYREAEFAKVEQIRKHNSI
jgi:hypothetical protein